jgi:murein endopeptidase
MQQHLAQPRRRPSPFVGLVGAALCCITAGPTSAGPLLEILEYVESRVVQFGYPAPSPLAPELAEQRRPRASIDTGGLPRPLRRAVAKLEIERIGELESQWEKAKTLPPGPPQLAWVQQRGLFHKASLDLLPLPSLAQAYAQVFRRRDGYRQRHWVRPELHALLDRAATLLAKEQPGRTVTVGDLAQDGGGQIMFGVRVELLRNDALRSRVEDFALTATLEGDALVRRTIVDPLAVFPAEAARFAEIEGPVLVEDALVALGEQLNGRPLARVERRRYYGGKPLADSDATALHTRLSRAWKSSTPIRTVQLGRKSAPLYRHTYANGERVLEVLTSHSGKGFPALSQILDVRSAELDRKKPGVWLKERRYRRESAALALRQWTLLYEATHISHMGGLDADVSYLMDEPAFHFSRDVSKINAQATLHWFDILDRAATETGVRIDSMLVDARVKRHLESAFPTKTRPPFWQYVKVSKGHDSHLHLRVEPGLRDVASPSPSSPGPAYAIPTALEDPDEP